MATATRAPRQRKAWTKGEWTARAIQLAEEQRYLGVPRCTAASLSGQTWTFAAPSRSQADVAHTVIYDLGADTLRCDCLAGTHGQPCKHAGAAIESVMRFHDEVRRAERRERERVG